jgi:hypothetical protein
MNVYATLPMVDGSDPNGAKYSLQFAASKDGGKTFGAPIVVSDVGTPLASIECTAIAVDAGDDKTIYISYQIVAGPYPTTAAINDVGGESLALAVSHDGGATWSNKMVESRSSGWGICPDVVSPAPGTVTIEAPSYNFPDVPMDTYVDTAKGEGFNAPPEGGFSFVTTERYEVMSAFGDIEFNGGSNGMESPRLFTDGKGNVCVTYVGNKPDSSSHLVVQCSADSGVHFGAAVEIDAEGMGRFHHPFGVFDGKNITVAYWVLGSNVRGIRMAKSTDGGKTFGKPATLSTYAIPGGDPMVYFPEYPGLAWQGGILWMSYLIEDGSGNARMIIDKSCDGGTTWSGAQLLNGTEPMITETRSWPMVVLAGGKMNIVSQVPDLASANAVYDVIPLEP